MLSVIIPASNEEGYIGACLAALIASELVAVLGEAITVEPALMQKVLEAHVRAQLYSLAEIRTGLG